jgi:uncharacterized membrane protein YeaQ/YmgE (transglycosylase-associated protein family)
MLSLPKSTIFNYLLLEGVMNLIIFLAIGALAGWLAGVIMKGGGFGLIGDIVVGILGSFLGGWLLPKIGLSIGGNFGGFITAVIGAVILLFIVRLIKKA